MCVGRTNGRSHSFVLDLFGSFCIKAKRTEETSCALACPAGGPPQADDFSFVSFLCIKTKKRK